MRQPASEPSSDFSVFIGLSTCLAGASVFALFMYWLFQPLQLENPGLAAYQPPKRFAVELATSVESAASLEQASVLAAATANGHAGGTAAPVTAQASALPAVEPQPKAKAVAQAKPRRPAAEPYRRRDDYAPRGYAQHPYSDFGRWF